jgi:hypothetical protein
MGSQKVQYNGPEGTSCIERELSKEQMKEENECSDLSCEQHRKSGEAVMNNHIWYNFKTRSR